jgi:serine protease Do
VIIGFNGNPVVDPNALRNAVAATAPGSQVELTVWRNGGEQRLRVTLGELNTQARQQR